MLHYDVPGVKLEEPVLNALGLSIAGVLFYQ